MSTNPTPVLLSSEREAEIREWAPGLAAAYTAWLDRESPLHDQQMGETVETLLKRVPGLLAELDRVRAENARLLSERHTTNAALAERDVALKAAENRIAELESDDIATQYGIRTPDGDVLNSTEDYKESVARLGRYQDTWPDAVLVQRTVRRGEWTEAE